MLDLPDEVLSLRLASVRLAPWQAESISLFARTELAGHSPTELIDQFKARLGDGVCSGIVANDDHHPELAMESSCTAPANQHANQRGVSRRLANARRPLWLFDNAKTGAASSPHSATWPRTDRRRLVDDTECA